MQRKIKIVADSASDVRELTGIDFATAPLKISTSEREFVDDLSLDVGEMAGYLKSYKGTSRTACPSIGEWLMCFGDAEEIYCFTITATLSGSYNSCMNAKAEYEREHPERRVYVCNSLSTGPEMGLLIEKTKELISSGKDFDEVCLGIEEYSKKTGLIFMLESMKNLANNGRVSKVAASIAGVLGIRAIGKASDRGDLQMLDKARGEKKALETIVSRLKEFGLKCGNVLISHCLNERCALSLKELIEKEISEAKVRIQAARGLCTFYAESGGLLIGFEKC